MAMAEMLDLKARDDLIGEWELERAVNKRAIELKAADSRDKDKHWLLIYQAWTEAELRPHGQGFLADLKSKGFEFFSLPKPEVEKDDEVGEKIPVARAVMAPVEAKDDA